MSLQGVITDLDYVSKNLPIVIGEIFKDNEKVLISLLRDQVNSGVTSEGSKIIPSYAQSTINNKRRLNKPYDRVTLKDKGGFYKGFKLIVDNKKFDFTSTNWKKSMLLSRYQKDSNGDILELQDSTLQLFLDQIVVPELLIRFKRILKI